MAKHSLHRRVPGLGVVHLASAATATVQRQVVFRTVTDVLLFSVSIELLTSLFVFFVT